jgi:hypothetical protein
MDSLLEELSNMENSNNLSDIFEALELIGFIDQLNEHGGETYEEFIEACINFPEDSLLIELPFRLSKITKTLVEKDDKTYKEILALLTMLNILAKGDGNRMVTIWSTLPQSSMD